MDEPNRKTRKRKGGKAIASGGFGCVFSPALKCEHSKTRENGKISKLMTAKHATQEYEEITNIKDHLKDIKNYDNYFVLNNITMCKPAKLSNVDLEDYKRKCTALPKDSIRVSNINEPTTLSRMIALNIPNAGIPVDDYLYKDGNYTRLYNTHLALIDLLKNGIIPMNKRHVYHSDMKDSNVLIERPKNNPSKYRTRLIDWGLSVIYYQPKNKGHVEFPKNWKNRPIQFNVPFSVILFTEDFYGKYSNYLLLNKQTLENKNLEEISEFVVEYFNEWMKTRGSGHYKFINEIMYMIYSHDLNMSDTEKTKEIETSYTIPLIIHYIANVLIEYTRFKADGTLDLRHYLNNVYVKIVDLWGFVSVYLPVLEMMSNNYVNLNVLERKVFEVLKETFIYIYTTPNITLKEIVRKLNELTAIFRDLKTLDGKQLSDLENKQHTSKDTQITKTHTSKIFTRQNLNKRFKKPLLIKTLEKDKTKKKKSHEKKIYKKVFSKIIASKKKK